MLTAVLAWQACPDEAAHDVVVARFCFLAYDALAFTAVHGLAPCADSLGVGAGLHQCVVAARNSLLQDRARPCLRSGLAHPLSVVLGVVAGGTVSMAGVYVVWVHILAMAGASVAGDHVFLASALTAPAAVCQDHSTWVFVYDTAGEPCRSGAGSCAWLGHAKDRCGPRYLAWCVRCESYMTSHAQGCVCFLIRACLVMLDSCILVHFNLVQVRALVLLFVLVLFVIVLALALVLVLVCDCVYVCDCVFDCIGDCVHVLVYFWLCLLVHVIAHVCVPVRFLCAIACVFVCVTV